MHRLNDFIGRQLVKGEEVLWSGQPDPSMVFSKADVVLIPAGVLWAAMAIFFSAEILSASKADSSDAPLIVFFAVPFTLLAFHATLGRFVFRRWVKSRTHYVVTNERVLALSRVFGDNVHAWFLDEIDQLTTVKSKRGAGSIWFGEAPWWLVFLGSSVLDAPAALPGNLGPVVFYDLRDVNRVYDLVNELRSSG